MRSIAGVRPPPADVVLAVALAIAAQVEIWAPQVMPGIGEVTGSRLVLALTALGMTLPLALRRVVPVAVLATVLAAASLQSLLTTPTEGLSSLAALLVATYSASAYTPRGRALASGVLLIVGVALIGQNSGDQAFLAIVLGSVWLIGFVVGQRSGEVEHLTDTNRSLTQRLATAGALLSAAEQASAPGPGSAPAPGPHDLSMLTARELEVARAIATGRSNAEIATLLVISEWTVKTHVASILRKLGLRDRAQVVVAAYESGLVTPGQSDR